MDLVRELRKFEGVNTSFDYGIELAVMAVKESCDEETIGEKLLMNELMCLNLFKYDPICKKGFLLAKEYISNYLQFRKEYFDFIRVFRYDETVYASISEYKIYLYSNGKGEIWKQEQIDDLMRELGKWCFEFTYEEKSNGEVVFKLFPKED